MDPDAIGQGGANVSPQGPSRLSVSSPGRLLLRPPELEEEEAEIEPQPVPTSRHHARRESYSHLGAQNFLSAVPDMVDIQYPEDAESPVFSPPSNPLSSVRRIIREDSVSEHRYSKSLGGSSGDPPSRPLHASPSSQRLIPDSEPRREPVLRSSSLSIPILGLPLSDHPTPKHLSCVSRILPNVGLVLILATIWLVILVYGEYSYPHSHSQFCNSYLPKESLLGRVVVISNPSIAQLQLKGGFFNNLRTSLASFLSDFNMRRDYRILQQKCAPNAFLFTGTLVATGSPQGTSDNPSGTIDEEAYISLLSRWSWIFAKSDTSPFLFSPSTYDVAFQPDHQPSMELERRILYQRFVDYFGPLNWVFPLGPYTLASVFTPSLDLDATAAAELSFKSSISAQMKAETESFVKNKLVSQQQQQQQDGAQAAGNPERRLVMISPLSFWPEINATCADASELETAPWETEYMRHGSLSKATSEDLLKRLNPLAVVAMRSDVPRCALFHKQTSTSQITAVSYSSDEMQFARLPQAVANLGRSRRPGVLVLEARNASMISSSGASNLLSSTFVEQQQQQQQQQMPQQQPTRPFSNTTFDLNTVYFDTTTYMDMKGPYIRLVFLSIFGCMISVEASPGSSEFFATSTLIETSIAISKFAWVSFVLIIRRFYALCSKTPLKSCLTLDLESAGADSFRPPWDKPTSRFLRLVALRFQITLELMLICSIIVVPWCVFVMFHWM